MFLCLDSTDKMIRLLKDTALADGGGQDISITRQLIDAAMEEMVVERKSRLGFQVA
jgi:hypothetical protein